MMQSLIIRDSYIDSDLKNCLTSFFKHTSIDYLDSEKDNQKEDILFECVYFPGDFKVELCLYTNINFSIESLSFYLSKELQTQVLMSENDSNPFSWILISENGNLGKVYQVPREDDFFELQRTT